MAPPDSLGGYAPSLPNPTHDPAPLDVTRYPHILDVVVALASHDSLLALRAADRSLRDKCDALLANHLVLRYVPSHPGSGSSRARIPAYLSSPDGRVPALLEWNRQTLREERALALCESRHIPGMTEMSPLRGEDYLAPVLGDEYLAPFEDISPGASPRLGFMPAPASPYSPSCLGATRVLDIAGARDTHLAKLLACCAPLVRTGRDQDGYHALTRLPPARPRTGSWPGTTPLTSLAAPQAVMWTHLWDWGHPGPHDYDHGPHLSLLSARDLTLNLTFDPQTTRNSCIIDIQYAPSVRSVTAIFHPTPQDCTRHPSRLPHHPYVGDLPTPPPTRTLSHVVAALYAEARAGGVLHTFVNLGAIPASWWGLGMTPWGGPWDDTRAQEALYAALMRQCAADPHPLLEVEELLGTFRVLSVDAYRDMVGEEMFELYTG